MFGKNSSTSEIQLMAELRKATISFIIAVRRSVRMKQLSSHWTDFHVIWHLIIFRKSVEIIHVSLKSDKKTGTLHENLCTLTIIPLSFGPRMRNVSDGSCRENQDTHSVFSVFFFGLTVFSIRFECYANWADAYKESLFFPENRTVYEVEWKNTVKKGRPQMAV